MTEIPVTSSTLSPMAASETGPHAIDWASVFAGASVATAIGLVLLAFGAALGLSVASPYEGEGLSPAAFAVAAGLYFLWVQLISFGAAGYVGARLRPRAAGLSEHETDTRDALHGALIWSVGIIAAALIASAELGAAKAPQNGQALPGVARSVADVAERKVAQGAAQEAANEPEAATATQDQRRAEVARKLATVSAFIVAASLLAGAVVAIFMAGVGGRHRDESTTVGFFHLRPTASHARR